MGNVDAVSAEVLGKLRDSLDIPLDLGDCVLADASLVLRLDLLLHEI